MFTNGLNCLKNVEKTRLTHNGEHTWNGGFNKCSHFDWQRGFNRKHFWTTENFSGYCTQNYAWWPYLFQGQMLLRSQNFEARAQAPNTTARTVETLSLLKNSCHFLFTVQICLPLISTFLHPPLKEFLLWTKFSSDDDLKSTMSKWLKTLSKDFSAERIQEACFPTEKINFKEYWKIKQRFFFYFVKF